MNRYAIFILKSSGKAVRYSGDNFKNKKEAIEKMAFTWEAEKISKNNKAMYVANLVTGDVTQMMM